MNRVSTQYCGWYQTKTKDLELTMKITFNSDVLFSLTSAEEEKMLEALHEYLDNMFFAN
jgi:hypothetical protein